MPFVQVREEESFENALRRFKRKCEKEGILTELRKRQHFEKPSVKRKRKAIQARKTIMRAVMPGPFFHLKPLRPKLALSFPFSRRHCDRLPRTALL